MGTIISQNRNLIITPVLVEVSIRGTIHASLHNNKPIIIGAYSTRERALEVLEEIFKSEYYEMPKE